MPGPLLNLLVPSVTDAEQHLPATNESLVSLSEAGKAGDNSQESAFTGVLRRAISETDGDSPATTVRGFELPPGGNLLPDPQASGSAEEVLLPEGAADSDGFQLAEEGEQLVTEGDMPFLPTFQAAATTIPSSFSSQTGLESQNTNIVETTLPSPDIPANKQAVQKMLPPDIADVAVTPNEKPAFGNVKQASLANPVSVDKIALSRSSTALGEHRRAGVSEQLHQRIANKLSAANARQPVLNPDNRIEKTPLPISTLMSGVDRGMGVSDLPGSSAPHRPDYDWGQPAAPIPAAAGERNPVHGSPATSVANRSTAITGFLNMNDAKPAATPGAEIAGPAIAAASAGNRSPAAIESLRQNLMDVEYAPGTRAVAVNLANAAATATPVTRVDRQTEAAVVSGLSSTPLGNLQPKSMPQSLRDTSAGKTTAVIGESPAAPVPSGTTRYQTTMEIAQPIAQTPAVGTAVPETVGVGQAVNLQADSQAAPTSLQAALNPGSVSAAATPNATPATLPGTTQMSVDIPVGHAAWEQSMARHVLQAGHNQLQTLQIKLNPANLGALEVHIAVEAETTSIVFSSHHAVVREAVEGAIPRLREMFSASGLNLGDVNVANHGAAEEQGRQSSGQHAGEHTEGAVITDQPEQLPASAINSNDGNSPEQLLDYYI